MQFSLDYIKLLNGVYEAERLPHDLSMDSPVPDFAYNILNTMGLLYKPIVDETHQSKNKQPPDWPEGRPFAVCLTHDVDDVSYFSLRQSLRAFTASFGGRHLAQDKLKQLFRLGFKTLGACRGQFFKDPLHCYERWLKIEDKFGARSTFFFWPGWRNVKKTHWKDPTYELDERIPFAGFNMAVSCIISGISNMGSFFLDSRSKRYQG